MPIYHLHHSQRPSSQRNEIHPTSSINTTISEQDATTDNLLTNATSSSVIILRYVCCIQTVINLCISCVLKTCNKDDDDDDDDDDDECVLHLPSRNSECRRCVFGSDVWLSVSCLLTSDKWTNLDESWHEYSTCEWHC